MILSVLFLPFLLSMVASFHIFIQIARASFQDLTTYAKVATVFYFCACPLLSVPGPNTYMPFVLTATTAVYSWSEGSVRDLSKLEIWFVVLSVIGTVMVGLFRVIVIHFILPFLYNEWIRTYSLGSKEDLTNFTAEYNRWINGLVDKLFPEE
jgi:ABC-type anion transport system duplicated permease subunit